MSEFYERPMVKRIAEIFGNPQPVAVITEQQFDLDQKGLDELARTPWHRIGTHQYWYYLLNLKYGPSQQELFDYLFPAFLIIWWEAQLEQRNQPYAETDFYSALEVGECLYKRMDDARRALVEEWMADAFIEGIDAWSGKLSFDANNYSDCDRFVGPIFHFNALGQSTMLTPLLWNRLVEVKTPGRAQFWLVLLSGIAFAAGDCEFIPESHDGCSILGSYAEHTSGGHGYFADNLTFMRQHATVEFFYSIMKSVSQALVEPLDREWATAVQSAIQEQRFAERLAVYLDRLDEYELGSGLDLESD